jgi:hypothetical protein
MQTNVQPAPVATPYPAVVAQAMPTEERAELHRKVDEMMSESTFSYEPLPRFFL